MRYIDLPRKLIYTDRRNLDDFLSNDELNEELYKVYLGVKDRPYIFKFKAEDAFNEAYYIATMAMNEPHPELDVRDWWYIARKDIGWAYAANLVMSMVYAILSLQRDKPKKIGYVLSVMQNGRYGEEHFPFFKKLAEEHPLRYKSDFSIRPCPVDELKPIVFDWVKATDDYNQDTIRELVSFLPSKEERLKFIDMIQLKQEESERPRNIIDELPF